MVDDVSKKVIIDARTADRAWYDILSLAPGIKTDTGIDFVSDTKNQYLQIIHTNIFESSRVEMNCLDANGKMTHSDITTDDYPTIIGVDTASARVKLGEGEYILNAIKNSTGKDPKELIEELAKAPNRVSLSYEASGHSAMDEICASPEGQAIQTGRPIKKPGAER